MASEPYLMNRKQACYRAPLAFNRYPRVSRIDPNCTVDNKYTGYFRDRWRVLRQDVCKDRIPKPLCPQVLRECAEDPITGRKLPQVKNPKSDDLCVGELYKGGLTQYNHVYQYPWSHNNVDDCCPPECPCLINFPDPPEIDYVCKGRSSECPPMENCTTYKHFFTEKPVGCPPVRYRPEPYDPCGCPLESATSYRMDYDMKEPVPTGPPEAQIIERGMWSMDQFCGDVSTDTESKQQFYRKCGNRPPPIINPTTLTCGEGRMDGSTETCSQFNRKCANRECYPDWIHNDQWVPPETPLQKCTTYKHFYRPHEIRPYPGCPPEIKSPDAIPFSTLNNIWYTCCDPEVDQRIPVEMRDRDPWPIVVTCPIKYQDNLKTDPCAPFRDDTTYKFDYYAKKKCVSKNYKPNLGYIPPVVGFNDNTTNRVNFVAYSPDQIKNAKTNAGNPNGIKWGPYRCEPNVDKCDPRFPAPYGHPLKPYTRQCPCGLFDDRSMYHRDFKFWTPEMVDIVNEEHCTHHGVPKGVSLYRASFSDQGGKKAEVMPPPKSKGHRCMNPCNHMDLESLYKSSYTDFWETMPRDRVEKYRGKPTIKVRREKENSVCCDKEGFEVFSMPPGTTVEETLQYLQQQQQQCENKK